MSIFSRLIDSMRVNSDAEDDDYFDDEQEYDEKPAARNIFSRKDRDDDFREDEPESRPRIFASRKVTPVKRSMEVSMIKPTSVEDARDICDRLLEGKAVVLNMEGIHTELAQRIIDFTSGATYSMDGKLQKISNYIFIVTPASVELTGDFQDLLNANAFDTSGFGIRL